MIFMASDQDRWPSAFEHCSGKSQSPVNIDTRKVFYDPRLPAITLEGYDLTSSPALTLINNGHTCKSRPRHSNASVSARTNVTCGTIFTPEQNVSGIKNRDVLVQLSIYQ